jgi:2-dehydro-3-deoxyphosphogluconate aldolase/(4S)-4-hydroxy-2-oxoglutarate aldolase
VRASSSHEAKLAVEAVYEGGIPVVEITMTVPGAVEIIHELAKARGSDVLIGAGTVLDAAAARRCLDAGAQFIVSPGLDLPTLELVLAEGKVMTPGKPARISSKCIRAEASAARNTSRRSKAHCRKFRSFPPAA